MIGPFDPRSFSVAFIIVSSTIGCGSTPGAGQERFVPTTTTARTAIESALQAWQRGEPAGEVKDTHPQVFVADTHRQKGQTLERYEILGEVPGDTPRCFLIKLKLANPDAEEKVRYAVIGINPLWVFRHEDLEMLTRWEHPMPAPDADKDAKSATSDRQTDERLPEGPR